MKNLKTYYDEIYKCSKCGLCQSVCPVFKITKNEASLSRGKFLMLLNYLDDNIPLSKTIKKYLDMCTSCGACTKFCPSDCDANKIFTLAKFQYKKSQFAFLYRFLLKIPYFIRQNIRKKQSCTFDTNKLTVMYFEGCTSKSSIGKNSTLALLKKLKINVIIPNFECCGIVAQSFGDKELFEQQFTKNIELLKNNKVDYIIFDCASCIDSIKNYDKYFEIENFEQIKNKCISILEFLEVQNVKFKDKKNNKITYHKPCHQDYDINCFLNNIENINYIEMNDYDKCCGFSGKFAITHLKIATQMFQNKAKNIDKAKSDIVLTSCPSCIIGLKLAQKYAKNHFKIMNIIDYLNKLEIIS